MLTLLVHGVLLTLFILFGNRTTRRELKAELQFVSLWPDTRPVPPSTPSNREPGRPSLTGTGSLPPAVSSPSTPEVSVAPAAPDSMAPVDSGARIDWYGEAAKVAAAAGEPARSTGDFREPPKKQREPCKPKESNWEWNSEVPKAGLLPLPYVVLADRCFISLGFFACAIGELPPPNSHLLDDMEGRDLASSVPSPHLCD